MPLDRECKIGHAGLTALGYEYVCEATGRDADFLGPTTDAFERAAKAAGVDREVPVAFVVDGRYRLYVYRDSQGCGVVAVPPFAPHEPRR